MTASLMLVIVAMPMLCCAKRLHLEAESENAILPIAAPMVHEAPMANTPVVSIQRLQAHLQSFPTLQFLFPTTEGLKGMVGDKGLDLLKMDSPDSLETPPSAQSGLAVPSRGINTVQSLELEYFNGRWYQMYGSPLKSSIAFGKAAIASNYQWNKDDSITVTNTGMGPDGLPTEMVGTIQATGIASPGQRKVSFDKFEGDYFIYKLGPVVEKEYQYAIVGEPVKGKRDQTQLNVLARVPEGFTKGYRDEALQWLSQNGFNSVPNLTPGYSYLSQK